MSISIIKKSNSIFDYGFIGRFSGHVISEIKRMDKEKYDYIEAYKYGIQSSSITCISR